MKSIQSRLTDYIGNKHLVISFAVFLIWALASCSNNDDSQQMNENVNQDICNSFSGPFPRYLNLPPGDDNGSYDPTLAGDPESGRVWMVFSRVRGPGGAGQVSTHLAYSDDHGLSWCYKNEINVSEKLSTSELPEEFKNTAVSAHWSHEVPSLAYVAHAPEAERWQMTWHRYLHVDDGVPSNDDRQFAYGWIGMRTAASPELLAQSPERKLFSAQGYYKDTQTESYNNSIIGPPELKINDLNPDLATTALLTESGMQVFNNELYISLLKGDLVNGNGIILIKESDNGSWEYISTLLTASDALSLNSSWASFSATDLFTIDSAAYLLVSPESDIYDGLALFELDVESGILVDSDNNVPDLIWQLPKTSGSEVFQTGVGTYDELCYETGIIYGDAVVDSPQFRIFASGYIPE